MRDNEHRDSGLPLTPAEESAAQESAVPSEERGAVEIVIEDNMVSITVSKFEELVTKAAKLDVIHRAYLRGTESWRWDGIMGTLFPEVPKDAE